MYFRRVVIGSPGNLFWRFEMLAGLLLVLAGVLIAVYPQILVALISAITILAGLALVGAGWRTRSAVRYRPPGDQDIIDI